MAFIQGVTVGSHTSPWHGRGVPVACRARGRGRGGGGGGGRASASAPPPTPRDGSGPSARRKAAGLLADAARLTEQAVESAKGGAAAARRRYQSAAAAVRELEALEVGGVLGADFSGDSALGRVSKVQDLEIPRGPAAQPLKPAEACSAFRAFAAERSAPAVADHVAAALPRLLHTLQACVVELSDSVEPLFAADGAADSGTEASVNSMFTLLHLAGFHTNRPAPLKPPALDAFPMKISSAGALDATLFGSGGASHALVGGGAQPPEYFPHLLVAFRGTGVSRDSGLLLGAKVRSLESYYLGWINNPLDLARKVISRRRTPGGSGNVTDGGRSGGGGAGGGAGQATSSPVVRRVFPSAKFSGWGAVAEFLLPVFVQEPTHRLACVAYRKFTPNADLALEARRQEVVQKARAAASRAVDPTRYLRGGNGPDSDSGSDTDRGPANRSPVPEATRRQTPGEFGPLRLELWRDVPWGHILHFLPTFAAKVTPRTRDVLRVDFLTFAGVASAVVTIWRESGTSPLLWAEVAGTVAFYGARIALRLRQALSVSRGLIAEERARRLYATDDAAIGVVARLATQQQFGIAASVLVAVALRREHDASPSIDDVQRAVCGAALCDAEQNEEWMRRLTSWGFIDDGILTVPTRGERTVAWD